MAARADAVAPDWVHLIPAGQITTTDKRGPYRATDAQAIIAASFAQADRLPVDENHATDLAAPKGLPAPARGWIVAMEARNDGIWGRVEWTDEGRAMVVGRAYRGISPVIVHTKSKDIVAVLRASLVNDPNLRGLATLHQTEGAAVDFMAKLAQMLGLEAGATEEQILAALAKQKDDKKEPDEAAKALQSSVDKLVSALGAEDVETALQAAETAKAGAQGIVALQATVSELTKQLNAVQADGKKKAAEVFIDGAIREQRVGVKPLREHYIARHMADPASVEKEIAAMPILGDAGITAAPPAKKDGQIALNSAQRDTAKLLGLSEVEYAKALAADEEAR